MLHVSLVNYPGQGTIASKIWDIYYFLSLIEIL